MERLPEKEAHSVSRGYSLNFHADSFSPPFLVSAGREADGKKKGRGGAARRGRRSLAHRAGNKPAPPRVLLLSAWWKTGGQN